MNWMKFCWIFPWEFFVVWIFSCNSIWAVKCIERKIKFLNWLIHFAQRYVDLCRELYQNFIYLWPKLWHFCDKMTKIMTFLWQKMWLLWLKYMTKHDLSDLWVMTTYMSIVTKNMTCVTKDMTIVNKMYDMWDKIWLVWLNL